MRYKIGFSFPHFDQKNLQHAHSHFAFTGWITHTLFVLIVQVLQRDYPERSFEKYQWLIFLNVLCAYGMLFSFAASGYSPLSITLSTATIFIGYVFAVLLLGDLKSASAKPYKNWFIAGMVFNVLSSLGTFALAYMMASHQFNQKFHLASLYYYLHFQYNGFFFFVCVGLFLASFNNRSGLVLDRRIFWLFFYSCLPAYFLSVLWMKVPVGLYIIIVLSAVVQLFAWLNLMMNLRKAPLTSDGIFKTGHYIFLLISVALTIKFALQLGSTVPLISKLAFGFRPIIIAYLHLILLAIISVFLVTYLYMTGVLKSNRLMIASLITFVFGVYFNELILGIQGVASFSYTSVPYANVLLLTAALVIVLGLIFLLLSQRVKTSDRKIIVGL